MKKNYILTFLFCSVLAKTNAQSVSISDYRTDEIATYTFTYVTDRALGNGTTISDLFFVDGLVNYPLYTLSGATDDIPNVTIEINGIEQNNADFYRIQAYDGQFIAIGTIDIAIPTGATIKVTIPNLIINPSVANDYNLQWRTMTNSGNNSVYFNTSVSIGVNNEPSFTKGANESILENSGAQTINSWATDLDKGAMNESGQILSFEVTNDNNTLFSIQPSIDANGNLTYTPADDANGTATISVTLSDNGGITNGGDDTYATQTFTITVNPLSVGLITTKGASDVFNVYPNPVKRELKIESEGSNIENVSVLDIKGNTIDVPSINDNIDVSGLSKGVYVLQIKSNNNVINKRFVKE